MVLRAPIPGPAVYPQTGVYGPNTGYMEGVDPGRVCSNIRKPTFLNKKKS